jgi:hypothetical protein
LNSYNVHVETDTEKKDEGTCSGESAFRARERKESRRREKV